MTELSAEKMADLSRISSSQMCCTIKILKILGLELDEVQRMVEILWDKKPCNE